MFNLVTKGFANEMSKKLFLIGLATITVTSLVNVSSSQAIPSVAGVIGSSSSMGNSLTGTSSAAGSVGFSVNPFGSGAFSTSSSMATPIFAVSITEAVAGNGSGVTAFGRTGSMVNIAPGGATANALAGAGNNGIGTSFSGTKTNVFSTPSYSSGSAFGNFGTIGYSY
jgi:hypothetical protein